MEARSNLFTCVNCGSQVQELFKQYSPTVLKLVDCVCVVLRAKVRNVRLSLLCRGRGLPVVFKVH